MECCFLYEEGLIISLIDLVFYQASLGTFISPKRISGPFSLSARQRKLILHYAIAAGIVVLGPA
jgi:hypothetical protein